MSLWKTLTSPVAHRDLTLDNNRKFQTKWNKICTPAYFFFFFWLAYIFTTGACKCLKPQCNSDLITRADHFFFIVKLAHQEILSYL